MAFIVNENNVQAIDCFDYNVLSGGDLAAAHDDLTFRMRVAFKRQGRVISGERRTSYHDRNHPVVKLTIRAEEEGQAQHLRTHMLIVKTNLYCYSIVAGGRWRVVRGAPYQHADNGQNSALLCGMKFSYTHQWTDGGPAVIYDAVQALQSDVEDNWTRHYHNLCQLFIEPVRTETCRRMVRATLVGNPYTTRTPLNDMSLFKTSARNWGNLSDVVLKGRDEFPPPPAVLAENVLEGHETQAPGDAVPADNLLEGPVVNVPDLNETQASAFPEFLSALELFSYDDCLDEIGVVKAPGI